jgi:hypothetical protein
MSQVTSWSIADGSGAAVRAALNLLLAAIQSGNSGTTAPTPTVAGMAWFDTTTQTLKVRNTANSAWVVVTPETIAANTLWGNPTGAGAALQAVSMTQLKTMLGYSQSFGASGYQVMPSGLIVQWGTGASGAAGSTVTFPTTFPNACYSVVGNHQGIVDVTITVNSITVTDFYVRAFNQSGGLLNAQYRYIAIGN